MTVALGRLAHLAARFTGQAVGFHKPHVPWYAPRKYWDYYPNSTITLAPHTREPSNVPKEAMQTIIKGWSRPQQGHPYSCEYVDLCVDIWPTLSPRFPYDNTTIPDWKARELRRAYWAALSYTDANIGRVLDALDASSFANNTVIAMWGDHGYQLGDNDLWAKQTNFEQATHIPFMVSVPGAAPRRSDALVEAVDLYPTLVEAATAKAHSASTVVPHCPASQTESRATAWCTEGFSLMPLIQAGIEAASDVWPRAAFSQFPRGRVMG